MSRDPETRELASSPPDAGRRGSLTIGHVLFLASASVASFEILLFKSFTAYDLLTALLFVLVLARGRIPIPPAGVLASGLVFLLFALLSTLRAPHPDQSLTQILQYLFILFIQLPVILAFTRSSFMIHASLVAFTLGTLFGFADVYLSPQQVWDERVGASFSESPNRLGYPTAYVIPFVCYAAVRLWGKRRARLPVLVGGVAVAYLMLWALAASGSRGATAGTIVGLAVFLSFRRGFSLRLAGLARVAAALLVMALCGTLLYRSPYFPQTLGERIERTMAAEPNLVQDRTRLAIAGWRAFEESPLLGVGLDNFRYVADRYIPTITQQLPHNLWIQLLAHTGIFGALGFLGMLVSWFGIMLRRQHLERAGAERELIWAFIASMSAIMTIFLFLPVLIQRQYWLVFGLGLSAALGRELARREGMGSSRKTEVLGS